MGRVVRRFRGVLLRLAMARRASILFGILLILPAAWLMQRDYPWEGPATDGLTLILGATGVALIASGVSGRRGDWLE